MIRIPFSTTPDSSSQTPAEAISGTDFTKPAGTFPGDEGSRDETLEARVSAMELKLTTHAEELASQVSDRVERIRCRIDKAMQSFLAEESVDSEAAEKVVEFETDEKQLHHLNACNARDAINELNQTLKITQEHLAALDCTVERMKGQVHGRN